VNKNSSMRLVEILEKQEAELLDDWMNEQVSAATLRPDLLSKSELRRQSSEFLNSFRDAIRSENLIDIEAPEWANIRDILQSLSRDRAERGFTPSETATFIFSLKQPLLKRLQESQDNLKGLVDDIWKVTVVIDKLGLYTIEIYQKNREQIILRQREELLELSTPVVRLWDGILAVPLIGTLDSERAQVIMENLLNEIIATDSEIAIIDITGVPTVDTLVAQHLIKTVSAARLMGADCIISGMRPRMAQTIVQMGIELGEIKSKSTLAGAFALALKHLGLSIS
jgi:rsbT co-antagonist protein RsbR